MEAHDPREQMREEPGDFAQESALALDAPQLLEEGEEGYDLRVRELLEGLVASSSRVEPVVGIVHWAEQNGNGLFQEGRPWGKFGSGHLKLLWAGNSDGPRFTLQTTQQTSRADGSW
jgi:hypothetical protein